MLETRCTDTGAGSVGTFGATRTNDTDHGLQLVKQEAVSPPWPMCEHENGKALGHNRRQKNLQKNEWS